MNLIRLDLARRVSEAVSLFWRTRQRQTTAQKARGRADQGARAAVTGGRQMDGFIGLFSDLIASAGVPARYIHYARKLELPGYFRAEKKWDLLVVREGRFIAAIEAKSQVGPSFGNNFNNRTEEAIGNALDIWTAYREGAFGNSVRPWLGYVFLLEDAPGSRSPVKVYEPHFKVFPEFVGASYMRRYQVLCRKLVLERHYSAVAFLTSPKVEGAKGAFSEPSEDLTFEALARSLTAHVRAFGHLEKA